MGLITDIIKGLPLSAVLEDKLKGVERDIIRLQTENLALKSQLGELEKVNATLREQLASILKPSMRRSDLEEKVLLSLWNQDPRYAVDIARVLGMVHHMAEFHLQELSNSGLVTLHHNMIDRTRYSLTHNGKRYLISKDLIK